MVALGDRLKVFARVRPLYTQEGVRDQPLCVRVDGASVHVNIPGPNGVSSTVTRFDVDAAYWSADSSSMGYASQESVSSAIGGALVTDALSGYNASLLAIGATGSGKSHSVFGTTAQPGVAAWTLRKLVSIALCSDGVNPQPSLATFVLDVSVSFLEVCGDSMRDLMRRSPWFLGANAGVPSPNLQLCEDPKQGVVVLGIDEVRCSTLEQAETAIQWGLRNRAAGATSLRNHSSRSHTLFVVTLRRNVRRGVLMSNGEPSAEPRDLYLWSRVAFFDLAGFEQQPRSLVDGSCFREGCAVNKGLIGLRFVVNQLMSNNSITSPRKDVDFRTTSLTFLLKDALSRNSRTQVLCTISPAGDCVDETVGALRFSMALRRLSTMPVRTASVESCASLAEMRVRETGDLCSGLGLARSPLLADRERRILAMGAARIGAHDLPFEALSGVPRLCGDASTPYLTNLSDDPLLAGTINYYLRRGEEVYIGASADDTIKMIGLSVPKRLCVFRNEPGVGVTLLRLNKDGRLYLASRPVENSDPVKLEHGQVIVFGRAFAMKFCAPAEVPGGTTIRDDDLRLDAFERECTLTMDASPTWQKMRDFVLHILAQQPQKYASAFLQEVELAVRTCDEANAITAECRPQERLLFEADVTGAVRPSVVVRVLRENVQEVSTSNTMADAQRVSIAASRGLEPLEEDSAKMAPHASGLRQQLYICSVGQMMERLDRMREHYHHFACSGGEAALDFHSLEDPWHETPTWAFFWRTLVETQGNVEATNGEGDAARHPAPFPGGAVSYPAPVGSPSVPCRARFTTQDGDHLLDRFEQLLNQLGSRAPTSCTPPTMQSTSVTTLKGLTFSTNGSSGAAPTSLCTRESEGPSMRRAIEPTMQSSSCGRSGREFQGAALRVASPSMVPVLFLGKDLAVSIPSIQAPPRGVHVVASDGGKDNSSDCTHRASLSSFG